MSPDRSVSSSPIPMANSLSTATAAITTAADLPVEILQSIRQRLPLADYLRFPAVCKRFAAAHRHHPPPFSDTEFPWLLSFFHGLEFASTVSLSPDGSLPPRVYSIPLPKRFHDYSVVSSDGHLLMIENHEYEDRPHNRGIHIVNPFDSWAQLGLLPSSPSLSADPANNPSVGIIRRIAMNGSVAVAAIWSYSGYNLGYTRLGIDRAWIELKDTLTRDRFQDVVAYKDGLFCALDFYARKVVALDFSSPPTVRLTDLTLNLPAYRDRNDGGTCFQEAQLVNSSSELFLVRWRSLVKVGETKRREVDVYKLMDVSGDDADKKWVPIRSLGNSSFFLGVNQSISLSTATFPKLRTNCIYIPWDAIYRMPPENDMYAATWEDDDDDDEDHRSYLIYDLGDQGWDEYYSSSESFYGFWMTPRLPSKSTC